MAFKHYGGSTPAGPTEWTCPTCQAVNTVPLKAGCQSCRAGADARKVEAPEPPAQYPDWPPTNRSVEQPPRVTAPVVDMGDLAVADRAFYGWALTRATAFINKTEAKEAFMAGVAWAQQQQGAHTEITDKRLLTEVPPSAGSALYLATAGEVPALLDSSTAHTILAALAFYRDNQLNYGAVPGQLTAEQVTALIARLTPAEEPKA